MDTTILQIPLSKSLKLTSQEVANEYGFSSLQDLLRVVLTKLSRRELVISIQEPVIHLSQKTARRYARMSNNFAKEKHTKKFTSVNGLMKDLRS
ncbi:MAG: hypothetical protein KKB09_07940 [Nanoarchaeota archaeon]|nr:hypothetical protein [Nanoarchaeota archaeon]